MPRKLGEKDFQSSEDEEKAVSVQVAEGPCRALRATSGRTASRVHVDEASEGAELYLNARSRLRATAVRRDVPTVAASTKKEEKLPLKEEPMDASHGSASYAVDSTKSVVSATMKSAMIIPAMKLPGSGKAAKDGGLEVAGDPVQKREPGTEERPKSLLQKGTITAVPGSEPNVVDSSLSVGKKYASVATRTIAKILPRGEGAVKDGENDPVGEHVKKDVTPGAEETPKRSERMKKFEKPPTPSIHPMATRSRARANPAFQKLLRKFEDNDEQEKMPHRRIRSVSPRTARSPSPSTALPPSLSTARSQSSISDRSFFAHSAVSKDRDSIRELGHEQIPQYFGLESDESVLQDGARTPHEYLCEDGFTEQDYLQQIQNSIASEDFLSKLTISQRSSRNSHPTSESQSMEEGTSEANSEEAQDKSMVPVVNEDMSVHLVNESESTVQPTAISHVSARRSSVLPSPINATTIMERVWDDAPAFDPNDGFAPQDSPIESVQSPSERPSANSSLPRADIIALPRTNPSESWHQELFREGFNISDESLVEDGAGTPHEHLCELGVSELDYLHEIGESFVSQQLLTKPSLSESIVTENGSMRSETSEDPAEASPQESASHIPVEAKETSELPSSVLLSSIHGTTVVERVWNDGPIFDPNEGDVPLGLVTGTAHHSSAESIHDTSSTTTSCDMDPIALKRYYRTLMYENGLNPDDYPGTRVSSDYERSQMSLSEDSIRLPSSDNSQYATRTESDDTKEITAASEEADTTVSDSQMKSELTAEHPLSAPSSPALIEENSVVAGCAPDPLPNWMFLYPTEDKMNEIIARKQSAGAFRLMPERFQRWAAVSLYRDEARAEAVKNAGYYVPLPPLGLISPFVPQHGVERVAGVAVEMSAEPDSTEEMDTKRGSRNAANDCPDRCLILEKSDEVVNCAIMSLATDELQSPVVSALKKESSMKAFCLLPTDPYSHGTVPSSIAVPHGPLGPISPIPHHNGIVRVVRDAAEMDTHGRIISPAKVHDVHSLGKAEGCEKAKECGNQSDETEIDSLFE